jgi:NAD(P)-dependent dehydrogenase (short-subunit alcohol dehydrogenase family)
MILKGKVALITGANSGIGYATCLLFAKEKCKILALDLGKELSSDLKIKLATLGAEVSYYSCDVSDYQAVVSSISNMIENNSKIDILVNNAGVLGPRKKTSDYPTSDFDRVIDVNIKGVYYLMKAILPHMFNQKNGSIINTASVAGHVGMAGHIAYSASKHAVVGMTKTAALEYAKTGIRVNAICPGFTQTSMVSDAQIDPEYLEALRHATPMKRFGEASEIANAILFMASDASSFMTGQSMILDGGLSAQ